MEASARLYRNLIEVVRQEFPDLAAQVESEVEQGRRVLAKSLPEAEQGELRIRMRTSGNRISDEDLASLRYSDDERLQLLIEALIRLGSSMTSSREAVAALANDFESSTLLILRAEESPDEPFEVELERAAFSARIAFESTVGPLVECLREVSR